MPRAAVAVPGVGLMCRDLGHEVTWMAIDLLVVEPYPSEKYESVGVYASRYRKMMKNE